MKLERGINLGGYLSQCVHSTEHYDAFIQEEDIRKIASMGFDHVRLAIDYEVLEDEYGGTREEGFAYVTRVVEWCKRQGLNIVLDLHKAYGYDFNNAGDQKKNVLLKLYDKPILQNPDNRQYHYFLYLELQPHNHIHLNNL